MKKKKVGKGHPKQVRFDAAEERELKKEAEEFGGLSFSAYIRYLVRTHPQRKKSGQK